MDSEAVICLGVEDSVERGHVALRVDESAPVARLAATFAIEGGVVEDELVECLVLGLDMAVAGDADVGFEGVVADEFLLDARQ